MTFFLMKHPEHTWGTPGIDGWGAGSNYDAPKFRDTLFKTDPYLDAS